MKALKINEVDDTELVDQRKSREYQRDANKKLEAFSTYIRTIMQ